MPLADDALRLWSELAEYRGLLDSVRRGVRELELSGLPPAAALTLGLALRRDLGRPVVFVTADWSAAESALEAAGAWVGSAGGVWPFPPREFLPYAVVAQSPEIHADRLRTLSALVAGPAERQPVVVLPVTALRRQLVSPQLFAAATAEVGVGAAYDPAALAAHLTRVGYERQALVEGPGSFALRGGILDVFPLTAEQPVRIEFEGETVASIRAFAIETQRSQGPQDVASIPPAREVPAPEGDALDLALARIRTSLDCMLQRFTPEQAEPRDRLRLQVEEDLAGLQAGTAPDRWEGKSVV